MIEAEDTKTVTTLRPKADIQTQFLYPSHGLPGTVPAKQKGQPALLGSLRLPLHPVLFSSPGRGRKTHCYLDFEHESRDTGKRCTTCVGRITQGFVAAKGWANVSNNGGPVRWGLAAVGCRSHRFSSGASKAQVLALLGSVVTACRVARSVAEPYR